MTEWPDPHTIDAIALALLGLPQEKQIQIIVAAFNKAVANNPHVAEPELDPRIPAFIADVFKRVAALEQMGPGRA